MGSEKYILRSSLLEAGDIILTSVGELPSAGIRKVTKGDYSHAILHVGGSSYIHSDQNGVHADNLQRLLFDSPDRVVVLRVADRESRSLVCDRAISYARRMVGTQYSKREAAASVLPRLRSNLENRQFCSRLVAQSFHDAGLRIVPDPSYCTPQDIHESDLLVEVPGCVRIASQEEKEFADGESPLKVQREIFNSLLDSVRRLTGADIQQYEQLAKFVLDNPHMDSSIADAVRQSGYLDIWRMDLAANPWRYDLELFLSQEMPPVDLKELARSEASSASEMIRRFEQQRQQYAELHVKFPRRYFALERNLYDLLFDLHTKRRNVALNAIASLPL